jgi:hypothetical protein
MGAPVVARRSRRRRYVSGRDRCLARPGLSGEILPVDRRRTRWRNCPCRP